MFSKILVANRGEIACRIMQTASKMGIETVAVYSDADANARHVAMAHEAVHIGSSPATESYLRGDTIIAAALKTGAEAIHPGYGFLSENPKFVDAVEAAGLIYIGPSAISIRAMGLKDAAKALMIEAGVPVVPGYHGSNQEPSFLKAEAEKIGYPVLIKARAGGGGKGMRLVERPDDFISSLESATREGQSAFDDPAVLIEKFITSPRHIEVQVFGDSHGNVVHLFERDCSLQRRHQKVIEEAPAPGMTNAVRAAMTNAAVTAAKAIKYEGAGTIEFIVDGTGSLRNDGFWFMEMNTRLQVEHPVSEAITGVDLVAAQLRVAAGEQLPFSQADLRINGHAFEARLYAEDVTAGFLPATGQLAHLQLAASARNDTGVRSGDTITPFYDPMIAKVITHGETRSEALQKLRVSLANTHIAGTVTNLDFLQALALQTDFASGKIDTGLIERDLNVLTHKPEPSEVIIAIALMGVLNIDPKNTGWRLWGEASHIVEVGFGDKKIKRRLVLSGGGSVRLEHIDDGEILIALENATRKGNSFRLTSDNVTSKAAIVNFDKDGQRRISVFGSGTSFEFRLADPLSVQGGTNSTEGAIVAPMTGIVQVVDVKVGATVKAGDRLAVMEAMKMEMNLIAPRDGVVACVSCVVGGSVDDGSVLIKLEEEA